MSGTAMNRRELLQLLSAAALGSGARSSMAAAGAAGPAFDHGVVIDQARALADAPFEAPVGVPDILARLDYDAYRRLRYRKQRAIWGGSPARFSMELFAPGFIYDYGIDVLVVESGRVRGVGVGRDDFETPSPAIARALTEFGRFAGFRLHYPLNGADYQDEFIVFQGASYFRAVSQDQSYGLSARGLAINVAEPTGEEFPIFRRFWVERPSADARAIVVHALLDSPSCSGAYRFAIYPGQRTTIDVDLTLFARRPIANLGVAPLTSMFMHGPMDASDVPDHRPAVHDSVGLSMHTGAGEWLWRPLTNPRRLQLSAFVDDGPRGFGLIQRPRDFAAFEDLEARYERRPSAWVMPRGDWGPGNVQLVEIPSDSEANDNIVAYWRPREPLLPGGPHAFAYRLTWPGDAPLPRDMPRVARSAVGRALGSGLPQVVFDLDRGGDLDPAELTVEAGVSAGRLVESLIQRNEVSGGLRVVVTFEPGDAQLVELRIRPHWQGAPLGATWLYRWLAS